MLRFLAVAAACLLPTLVTGCSKETPPSDKPAVTTTTTAAAVAASAPAVPVPPPAAGPALTIAYSDWPGWVAWDIAEQKGWL